MTVYFPHDMPLIEKINHYLLSYGTFYEARECVHSNHFVIVNGPDTFLRVYIGSKLLEVLAECGSTEDVRVVLEENAV